MKATTISLGTALVLALPSLAAAQGGAGAAGAQALQLLPGARAAALSGAYAAASADADAMFYNAAGVGALRSAAALSYQQYVQDVAYGSAALAQRIGPLVLGAGIAFLNAGEVEVVEPDPAFGGERGTRTGATAGASESAARVALAIPFGDRFRVGAAAGYATADVAGAARSATFFDAGAQLAISRVTLGAAVRNMGGALAGTGLSEAELPREARAGVTVDLSRAAFHAEVTADFVSDLVGEESWVVGGAEVGVLPAAVGRGVGLVGRVGFNGNTRDEAQGALVLGGGLVLRSMTLDYAYQQMELFGAVHRLGVRLSR